MSNIAYQSHIFRMHACMQCKASQLFRMDLLGNALHIVKRARLQKARDQSLYQPKVRVYHA